MQKVAINAEANLAEKRARIKSEKKVTYRDKVSPSVSSSDPRIDGLVKSITKMWEKMSEKAPLRDNQPNPSNKNCNQNFRKEHPQNKPRETDQQIRQSFNENYVDDDERDTKPIDENHLNIIGFDNESEVYSQKKSKISSLRIKMKPTMKIPKILL